MPEGDTIARAAAVLHAALAGQCVTSFEAALAPVAAANDHYVVSGRTVERVASRGKHLVMVFTGDLMLRTHMRMHGSWHLYRPGERWQRSSRAMRLRLDTAPWTAVAFDVYDAELVRARHLAELTAVAALGPDLLDTALDIAAAAARILAAGDRSVAEVLLDQGVVAGVGNVIRSEVLFLEGLDPACPVARLSRDRVERVVVQAARLLRLNARPGAGRRRTTGRMAPDEGVWVYQRTGLPCRRCGTPIASGADAPGGRRVYWCARCQVCP